MEKGFAEINEFPKDFRKELLDKIFFCIKRGQCIQLVGPTGSGKSLLLKAISKSSDIQKFHLGDISNNYKFVFVDLKFCIDKEPKSVLKFILSKLGENINNSDLSALVAKIESSVSETTKENNHLVIILDSFNELPNPAYLYEILKGLYDQNRGHLSYIFAVNHEVEMEKDLESFRNLTSILTENIIYIPPLDIKEFNWFIVQLENHLDIKLKEEEKKEILRATNGYMSTIKRVIETIKGNEDLDKIITSPEAYQRINYHFQTLLKDLSPERETLRNIVIGKIGLNDKENTNYLNKIGILDNNGKFTFPLFETFLINTYEDSYQKPKEVINDKISLNTPLTPLEFKVLKYLCNKLEEFCSRDEIIESVWGNKAVGGISDHALDQLVFRLRKKLEKNDPQLRIETVWGRGHKAVLIS